MNVTVVESSSALLCDFKALCKTTQILFFELIENKGLF